LRDEPRICFIRDSESTCHAKTFPGHHLKHAHHAYKSVATSQDRARTEANLTSYPPHLIDDRRNLVGLWYRIQFSQIQKDVEHVWAVGILLQCSKMLDDLLRCDKSSALGPNGSPVGIDLVSHGHDSILAAARCHAKHFLKTGDDVENRLATGAWDEALQPAREDLVRSEFHHNKLLAFLRCRRPFPQVNRVLTCLSSTARLHVLDS
jgi:hypothetical protein